MDESWRAASLSRGGMPIRCASGNRAGTRRRDVYNDERVEIVIAEPVYRVRRADLRPG